MTARFPLLAIALIWTSWVVPALHAGTPPTLLDQPQLIYFVVFNPEDSVSSSGDSTFPALLAFQESPAVDLENPVDSSGIPPRIFSGKELDPDVFLPQSDSCVPLPGPDERLSLGRDLRTVPTWMGAKLRSLATWENAIFLTGSAAVAVSMRGEVDHQVQDNIAQHGSYWGATSRVLNHAGESVVHIPLLAGLYSYSLYSQDDELHDLSLSLVTSYKFTALTTLALQYGTQTRHGDNGGFSMIKDNGFPSMPASTSFAMAAVVEEKYGWKIGVPAYTAAGLISWAGIDQQQHRVSDVVFGAALGYAVGKSIGAMHYHPNARFKLIPFVDVISGSQGLQCVHQF